MCLTLLGIALLTGVAGAMLAPDVTAHDVAYHAAMGLLLGTALPGAAGLVHVMFARLRDRKAGR